MEKQRRLIVHRAGQYGVVHDPADHTIFMGDGILKCCEDWDQWEPILIGGQPVAYPGAMDVTTVQTQHREFEVTMTFDLGHWKCVVQRTAGDFYYELGARGFKSQEDCANLARYLINTLITAFNVER